MYWKTSSKKKNYPYVQVVAVHSVAHTSLLLGWKLLFGKLEHQRLSADLVSTARRLEQC